MKLMYNLERKFGRFAIKNLSLVLIACYGVGYLIQFTVPNVMDYLTLDPYAIIHGEVWRLLSWIFITPQDNLFFVAIMLLFYYSIGTSLERTWGAFQYNVYIFSGLIFTVLGSFLMMGYCYLFRGTELSVVSSAPGAMEYYFRVLSYSFSTYYVNMSIFLAYAVTFPDHTVLLMFIIPIKMKWMAIVYVALLAFEIVGGVTGSQFGFVYPFAIGSSLLNFIVFFFGTRKGLMKNKAQREYTKTVNNAKKEQRKASSMGLVKHKCALCGKTEKDGDHLVFRYCSKCNGNFEFCQDHIYTHIHKE